MRTFRVVTRTTVGVAEMFRRSLDIDAHVGSMADSDETAVAGVTSGTIGLGETVTWRAKHFGIWFRMTSKVTELDEPHRFVDQQIRGPFRIFHHEHTFESTEDNGTIMTDTITLAAPIVGPLAEVPVLVPYLRKLIVQRNRFLTQDDPTAQISS